jgi:uncharacterized RDD family membrane protein YckC
MSNNEEQVYAAPEADLQDENTVNEQFGNLAGRGTRLGAVMLDTLITVVFAIVPGMILLYLMEGGINVEDESAFTLNIYLYALPFLLILFVIQGVLLYKYSQTIGKRLLKIKIVRTDGSRIAFGRLLGLRIILIQVLYQIPVAGGIFSLVDALFIFREDHKCIHDLIADTIVIDVEFEKQDAVEEM